MLGEKYCLKLSIDNKVKKLICNFRFIKNLNELLVSTNNELSAIDYLNKFILDKDTDNYSIDIIFCMLNGHISLSELQGVISGINIKELSDKLRIAILNELSKENIFNLEKEESEVEEEESSFKKFNRFWNSNYFLATVILKMKYKEFLESSPREIQTLGKLHGDYLKNIILARDVEISRVRVKANKEEHVEKIKCKRLRDIF